jgi:hypothetical protein
MIIYLFAIGLGIILRVIDQDIKNSLLYSTYKDLLPLIIAIPAAYLAYAFQRRNNYVQALRKLWTDLIGAVQDARNYTYAGSATFEEYTKTLSRLSMVIEEARGVFLNIKATKGNVGFFPFEPIKEIYDDIENLGFADKATDEEKNDVRRRINKRWKLVREQLLKEFDRDVPTYHYTWYTVDSKSNTSFLNLGDVVADKGSRSTKQKF